MRGDRGQRRRAVGHARVGRAGDAVLVRHQEGADGVVDRLKSQGLTAVPRAQVELRPRADVPRRSSATRARRRTSRRSASSSARSCPPRRRVHRLEPGRALRPEEVRHALHPRLPARPRRARRRVGDLGAVGDAAGLYDDVMAAARGAFAELGVQRLHHVPPLALLPLGRVPLLHVRVQAGGRRATGSSSTTS